jgi:hypothetical protein
MLDRTGETGNRGLGEKQILSPLPRFADSLLQTAQSKP